MINAHTSSKLTGFNIYSKCILITALIQFYLFRPFKSIMAKQKCCTDHTVMISEILRTFTDQYIALKKEYCLISIIFYHP